MSKIQAAKRRNIEFNDFMKELHQASARSSKINSPPTAFDEENDTPDSLSIIKKVAKELKLVQFGEESAAQALMSSREMDNPQKKARFRVSVDLQSQRTEKEEEEKQPTMAQKIITKLVEPPVKVMK